MTIPGGSYKFSQPLMVSTLQRVGGSHNLGQALSKNTKDTLVGIYNEFSRGFFSRVFEGRRRVFEFSCTMTRNK